MASIGLKLKRQYAEHHVGYLPNGKGRRERASQYIADPEECSVYKSTLQICFKWDGLKRSFYFKSK